MKKFIVFALMVFASNVYAQSNEKSKRAELRKERAQNMSAEEMAQLKTKKMTLQLDLNEEQQEKVYALVLEQTKSLKAKREERKSLNKEQLGKSKEKFLKVSNEKLDAQIAFKNKMKDILDDNQYQLYQKYYIERGPRKLKKAGNHKAKN